MENIKWCRKKLKISQKELANALGMDQYNYCNIENGKLILNSIPNLKRRAIDFLLPRLKSKVSIMKNEILELEVMIEALEN